MSEDGIIIRSDLENVINTPSKSYENNLQQELEFFLENSEDENYEEEEQGELSSESEGESDKSRIKLDDNLLTHYDQDFEESIDPPSVQLKLLGKVYVTKEEKAIIENCADPKLKQLLILNRMKAIHLKELKRNVLNMYNEVNLNLRKHKEKCNREAIKIEKPELQSMAQTYTWRIGMPFFKDHEFYSAPSNADVAVKKRNKEFFATKIVEGRKWTANDQEVLHNAVLESYFNHRRNKLESEMRVATTRLRNADGILERERHNRDLEELQAKQEELYAAKREAPPLNCNDGVDWLKIANSDLKGRHSYMESKAFWNIYLHPSINKTDWLPEENEKIKQLAIRHNYDWDIIAQELNTNRSPYLVCIHYNTKLCDKFRRQRFLPEEDEFLMEVVENCRLGDYIPWGRVAYYFEDRSKHQLYHRYRYYLSVKNIKKGTFTEAEDILLKYLVDKFGKNFSQISEFMPQRTSIQLRNRYSTYLHKFNVNLGNFTSEEDKIILKHVEERGNKSWSILARTLNRTRSHVRQRYMTLMKCIDRDPNLGIDSLPRRKQSFLSKCQINRQSRMTVCLEKIKKLQGIPTLATVETFLKQIDKVLSKKEKEWKVLKVPARRMPSEVDKKIVNFFKSSCKIGKQSYTIDEQSSADSARRIIKLFDTLGADTNVFKEAEVSDRRLLDHDEVILTSIKGLLEENSKSDSKSARSSFYADTVPGPSHIADVPKNPVKHLLPPNVNNVVGLRGMIIKYQIHKEANQWVNGSKTQDLIEENLAKCDELTKAKSEYERDLFYKRFCALFKWPCIISKKFPENLAKVEEESPDEEEEVIEKQEPKKKVGRPPKKVNTKILKMLEARKVARKANTDSSKLADDVSVCSSTAPESIAMTTPDIDDGRKIIKRKRGRPRKCEKEHAVLYIPRRAHIKMGKAHENVIPQVDNAMEIDDPGVVSPQPSTSSASELKSTAMNENQSQTKNKLSLPPLENDLPVLESKWKKCIVKHDLPKTEAGAANSKTNLVLTSVMELKDDKDGIDEKSVTDTILFKNFKRIFDDEDSDNAGETAIESTIKRSIQLNTTIENLKTKMRRSSKKSKSEQTQ